MTLVSVRVVSKPLSIGVLLFIAALALEPRLRRSVAAALAADVLCAGDGLMYLLCFGPQPRFLGVPFMYRAPYSWLMALPGYDAVRVPARFAMLAALCLSVVAALAFARLTRRARWPTVRRGARCRPSRACSSTAGSARCRCRAAPRRLTDARIAAGDRGDGAAAGRNRRRRRGDVPRHVPRPARGQRLQRIFPAELRCLRRGLAWPTRRCSMPLPPGDRSSCRRRTRRGGALGEPAGVAAGTVDLRRGSGRKVIPAEGRSPPRTRRGPADRLPIRVVAANINNERMPAPSTAIRRHDGTAGHKEVPRW